MAFFYIADEMLLAELAVLEAAPVLGIDLETAGQNPLEPYQCRVRLLQIATQSDTFVIDLDRVDPIPMLAPIFTSKAVIKVFHNAKFDVKMLLYHFKIEVRNLFCTYLAAQLMAMGDHRQRFGLAPVVKRYLDREIDKQEQHSDFGGRLSDAQIEYAALDAEVLPPLYAKLVNLLKQNKLFKVSQLEFRTVVPVAAMELRGIYVDQQQLRAIYEEMEERVQSIEQNLMEELQAPDALPGMNTLNVDAPEQVRQALAGHGIEVEDTADSSLRPLVDQYPFIENLLAYRHLAKILNSSLRPLMTGALPETGRVHACYQQIASASGRFACGTPNIQQVPREREVRACFQPEAGYVYVIADYSQVELRVAAGLSKDPIMINAYAADRDLHRLTAALTMDKPIAQVTPQERQAAKAINFGLIYAMGARGLASSAKISYGVELDLEEAIAFRERFFRNYEGLAHWQRRSEQVGKQQGFVRTAAGRIRAYRDEEIRVTELLNVPVQGTAAEGLKCAMFLFWEAAKEEHLEASIVAIIHDEIIVEVKQEDAKRAKQALETAMVRGIEWLVPGVKFAAEATIASSWAEKA